MLPQFLGISTAPFAGSVAAAATQAVAGALALLERVHVIDYEIWPSVFTDMLWSVRHTGPETAGATGSTIERSEA